MGSWNHFVAYHNSDEFGPFDRGSSKRGKEAYFFTAKRFREDTLKGQRLWAFEGSGSPKRYSLVSCGIITRIAKGKQPAKFRKTGQPYGTNVYFDRMTGFRVTDVTDLTWFRKLLRQQQSFRNGFNRLTDRGIIRALERLEATNKGSGERPSAHSDQRTALLRVRRSPSAAAEIVRQLVPEKYWKDVLEAVAHSIKVAHRADPSKWGLRLNRKSIRLKVGFVEVMTLGRGWSHELVQKDLIPAQLRLRRSLRFSNQPYRNAPKCDTCDMEFSSVRRTYEELRLAHEGAIRVAARSQRHTTTTKDHSLGLVVYLSQELGALLPQPSYVQNATANGLRIPEEIPPDEEFEEGAVVQVLVNRYERDPAARERCIQYYGTSCVVCGLSLGKQYGPEVDGLIHVHHLKPIASGQSSVDPVRDLRPVCPNCHAVIHRTNPPLTLEQVQRALRKHAPLLARFDM